MALLCGLVHGSQIDDLRSNPALLDLQKHGDVPGADGVDDNMGDQQYR